MRGEPIRLQARRSLPKVLSHRFQTHLLLGKITHYGVFVIKMSSYGLWLPWVVGGPIGGAIAGRALWLWLGVLDAIQGVGIGMALLQTLTRKLANSYLVREMLTLISRQAMLIWAFLELVMIVLFAPETYRE